MTTLGQFKKQNFIFQDNRNPVETSYHVIARNGVIEKPLSETYDDYGQMIGETNAGDYSVTNADSDTAMNVVESIQQHFEVDLSENQIYDLKEIIIDEDYDNIDQYDLNMFNHEKLKTFVEKWREENENKVMCTCYEHWDGHNWKSIIFDCDSFDYEDYREVSDEIYEKIYNESHEDGEEVLEYKETSPGIETAETESYIFRDSHFQGAYGIEIIEKSELEEE